MTKDTGVTRRGVLGALGTVIAASVGAKAIVDYKEAPYQEAVEGMSPAATMEHVLSEFNRFDGIEQGSIDVSLDEDGETYHVTVDADTVYNTVEGCEDIPVLSEDQTTYETMDGESINTCEQAIAYHEQEGGPIRIARDEQELFEELEPTFDELYDAVRKMTKDGHVPADDAGRYVDMTDELGEVLEADSKQYTITLALDDATVTADIGAREADDHFNDYWGQFDMTENMVYERGV